MFESELELPITLSAEKRFKEMEILFIYYKLSGAIGNNSTLDFLHSTLNIPYENRDQFNLFVTTTTNKPSKKEKVIYGRFKGSSYKKISETFQISPITINKYQKEFMNGEFKIMHKGNLEYIGAYDRLDMLKELIRKLNNEVN